MPENDGGVQLETPRLEFTPHYCQEYRKITYCAGMDVLPVFDNLNARYSLYRYVITTVWEIRGTTVCRRI